MTTSLTLHLFGGVGLAHNGMALPTPKSRKGLALFLYELGNPGWYGIALRDIALLFVQEEKPTVAAQGLGATAASRAATGVVIPPREVAVYEQTLAAARSGLGEDAFATAWAAGHAMTLEQAVGFALAELEHV